MVADHHDHAARIQPADRRVQSATQNGQLRVDFDPKGLEGALGGMSARAPRRGGDSRLDHVDQLPTLRDRGVRAGLHDEVRDAARPFLIRVGANDPSEICCVVGVNDLFCGKGLFPRIHPHVKRAVLLKGEAA